MNFNALIQDIESMVGLRICSIRPGSELIVDTVDWDTSSISIISSKDVKITRPFSEFRTLWTALSTMPIVHVENALHGSGTSRNQPETILANLPYIEWLRYDGKKHIAYVGRRTHQIGTLKQMSAQDAAALSRSVREMSTSSGYKALFVTNDIVATGRNLSQKLGKDVRPLTEGFYKCECGDGTILICSDISCELVKGVYTFVDLGNACESIDGRIAIGGHYYAYINIDGGKFLSRE